MEEELGNHKDNLAQYLKAHLFTAASPKKKTGQFFASSAFHKLLPQVREKRDNISALVTGSWCPAAFHGVARKATSLFITKKTPINQTKKVWKHNKVIQITQSYYKLFKTFWSLDWPHTSIYVLSLSRKENYPWNTNLVAVYCWSTATDMANSHWPTIFKYKRWWKQATCSSGVTGNSSNAYSAEMKGCPSKDDRYTS